MSVQLVVAVTGAEVASAGATTMLSNQASASGFPIGGQIYDSAMLGNGVNPTGSITFKLFGPDNPMCAGTPLWTTTTAVNGNSYYESSRYVSTVAGTYRWTAVYGGDANNNPSAATLCSDSAGQVSVAKRTPNLTAAPTWVLPSATDTATLTMGAGPTGPTGTMTFKLYGPGNMTCAGTPILTTVLPVLGNGWYTSATFTTSAPGTYQWVVTYSGDANNFARATICSDTTNGFTVAASSAVVAGSPTTVSRGATITVTWSAIASPTAGDWFALYAVGTPEGGVVTAWKWTGGGAGGSTSLTFPWGATAGNYEIRLMANNNIGRLATSSPITMVW